MAASWLGNGWIYAGIAIAIVIALGTEAVGLIWRSSASVAILHSIYRPLKTRLSRPRPFRIFPELQPLLPTLDEYSCPSGHAMTLTASPDHAARGERFGYSGAGLRLDIDGVGPHCGGPPLPE